MRALHLPAGPCGGDTSVPPLASAKEEEQGQRGQQRPSQPRIKTRQRAGRGVAGRRRRRRRRRRPRRRRRRRRRRRLREQASQQQQAAVAAARGVAAGERRQASPQQASPQQACLSGPTHEKADAASPGARRGEGAARYAQGSKKPPGDLVKTNAASSADAALHEAMESGELKAIMDAIHEHAETASPEVLEDARALRDSLREAKHAAEGTAPPLGRLGHRRQRRHEGSAGDEQAVQGEEKASQGEHSAAYMCKVLGRCPEGRRRPSRTSSQSTAPLHVKTGEQCDSTATEQAPPQQAPRSRRRSTRRRHFHLSSGS